MSWALSSTLMLLSEEVTSGPKSTLPAEGERAALPQTPPRASALLQEAAERGMPTQTTGTALSSTQHQDCLHGVASAAAEGTPGQCQAQTLRLSLSRTLLTYRT